MTVPNLSHFHKLPLAVKFFYSLFLLLLSLVFIFSLYIIFTEPKSPPENILVSNLSPTSFSLSWTTSRPTRGFLILNNSRLYASQTMSINNTLKNLHYVTVAGLSPSSVNNFQITTGFRHFTKDAAGISFPEIKTPISPTSLTTPSPLYGKIMGTQNNPTIIYVSLLKNPETDSLISSPLSALVSSSGEYVFDTGSFISDDQLTYLKPAAGDRFLMAAVAANGQKAEGSFEVSGDTQIYPLELK